LIFEVEMKGRFSGTVTFITGASSGIGAALAREIARQGGDLALAARREERLRTVSEEIRGMGRRALALTCDVTRDGDVEQAAAKVREAFGRIDYVIANAGFGVIGKFDKLSLEDFRRQFETNVFGVLRTVKATQGDLIASSGCLAIIGSVNGYIAQPGLSAYAMSKFALLGLADSLRHELRPHGVGVVHIAPGFIDTEIRKVDNQGVYHPEARDRVPPRLRMPAEKAARQIADAIFPALISFVVSRIELQGKRTKMGR
jgi:NAD(P)-dependent dehydrogenase (short-subunit alcohol dehydrogenase family)